MLAAMLALQLGVVSHRVPVAVAETLHVEVSGPAQGAPVVLVPGFAGSAYAFRHVAAGLAGEGARVIVIEPLAIGMSSRPKRADYSLTAQARRLSAVLDSLAVGDAVVVGQGINATTVVRVALARPDLVERLVLIEGGGAERAAGNSLRRIANTPGLELLGYGRIRNWLKGGMQAASGDPSWVTDEVVDAYLAGVRADFKGSLAALKAAANSEESDRIADRLPGLRPEVVLLLGGAKHKSGPSDREVAMLRNAMPRIEVHVVPGAGHHLAEEAPVAVLDAVHGGAAMAARVQPGQRAPTDEP